MGSLLHTSRFEHSLKTRGQKMVAAALVIIPCCVLAFAGAREIAASILGGLTSPESARDALALEAASPEIRHRLGLEYLYGTENPRPAEGLSLLRQAATMAPERALYWADLASGCAALDKQACADAATQRALSLAPMMPRLHWLAAGYYLAMHRRRAAQNQLRDVLNLSPTYADAVFSLCLRDGLDEQTVTRRVIPSEKPPNLMLEYAYYLAAHGRFAPASRVWQETAAGSSPFPFSLATPYINTLMGAQQYAQAWNVWRDLARRRLIESGSGSSPHNLVFNGDFGHAPLDSGFDWICGQEAFVSLEFPASVEPGRAHGLRLTFTVSRNREYEPLFQIVPVAPNRTYQLSARVRSIGITSDSGPRLRIIDPADPGRLSVASVGTIGTTPWHAVTLAFATGPDTRFVQLSVWRPPSRGFPSGIAGSFWIDSISLEPVGAPSKPQPSTTRVSLAGSAAAGAAMRRLD